MCTRQAPAMIDVSQCKLVICIHHRLDRQGEEEEEKEDEEEEEAMDMRVQARFANDVAKRPVTSTTQQERRVSIPK